MIGQAVDILKLTLCEISQQIFVRIKLLWNRDLKNEGKGISIAHGLSCEIYAQQVPVAHAAMDAGPKENDAVKFGYNRVMFLKERYHLEIVSA